MAGPDTGGNKERPGALRDWGRPAHDWGPPPRHKLPPPNPEREKLKNLFKLFAAIIFVTPMIRSGFAELFILYAGTPVPGGGGSILWIPVTVALICAIPVAAFAMWSRPRVDRIGLPKRSYWLLCILLAFLPIQIIFRQNFYSAANLAYVDRIDDALPVIWVIRNLDKPALLLLAIWVFRRGNKMQEMAQLLCHFLLFLCLLWALCGFIDFSFGESFLER